MSDVTNGKGGVVSVTDTAQLIEIVPSPSNGGGNNEFANTVKVWNTGSSTVYAQVGLVVADFSESVAIPIPADSDFWFVTGRKPIKKLVLKCATGETSTANYGAF
jgi:hypothetical protein